jgi:putative transposase
MKYKKWTLKEKLEILSTSEEIGVVETCRKYSHSTGTFYSWKKKFDHKGEAVLKVSYDTKNKEHKDSEEENRVLRKLLSDREIELEVQRELLKKSLGRPIQERFSRCHLQET